MCSRWNSHDWAISITASSALLPRQGAPAECALAPRNLKMAEMSALDPDWPQETPRSTLKPFSSRMPVRYFTVSNSWKPGSAKEKTISTISWIFFAMPSISLAASALSRSSCGVLGYLYLMESAQLVPPPRPPRPWAASVIGATSARATMRESTRRCICPSPEESMFPMRSILRVLRALRLIRGADRGTSALEPFRQEINGETQQDHEHRPDAVRAVADERADDERHGAQPHERGDPRVT